MLNRSVVSFILLFLSTSMVNAADLKIGVVDVQEVASKVPQFKNVSEDLLKKFQERRDELQALLKKSDTIQENAKRDALTLTNVQKMQAQRELKAIEVDFKLKQAFLEEDLKIANSVENGKVTDKIKAAIQKVVKSEKLDLVLSRDVVIHLAADIDITEKVIKILSNPAG